ncbi:SRPBCC domain-containing protein [Kribbella catacumbae]|nr:SRPBCC domain-containing protein [Kribbella catacumbae]
MESIEREVDVEARPELVWTALTQPEHFATWPWHAFRRCRVRVAAR